MAYTNKERKNADAVVERLESELQAAKEHKSDIADTLLLNEYTIDYQRVVQLEIKVVAESKEQAQELFDKASSYGSSTTVLGERFSPWDNGDEYDYDLDLYTIDLHEKDINGILDEKAA